MKKIFLSVIILAATVTSCQKEESGSAPCNTNMASIAGSYKVLSMKYKASTGSEQDFLEALEDCEKDDIVKLNADGTANYQDAGTVCTPGGSYNSTWSLSGNTITMDGDAATIQLFDCKKLVVVTKDVYEPGDIYTVTYQKQ